MVLKLKGEPVLNARDFARQFDLCDALRRRDALAAFAEAHLSLAPRDRALVTALKQALRGDTPESPNGAGDCWTAVAEAPEEAALAERAFPRDAALAGKADPVQWRCFCVAVTALTLLAVRYGAAFQPPDVPRAFDAWSGRAPARMTGLEGLAPERVDEDMTIIAGDAVIELPVARQLPEKLELRTLAIDVSRSSPRGSDAVAKLKAGNETLEVPVGGRAYVNVCDGRVVRILPTSVTNGDFSMRRGDGEPDVLILQRAGAAVRLALPGVSSFAVERKWGGFLAVCGGKLSINRYSNRNDPNLIWAARREVVEVEIRNQYYLVLLKNGMVVSDHSEWNDRRNVVRLSDL